MENTRKKCRSGLVIVAIMMTLISCRKSDDMPVPVAKHHVRTLQVQARGQQSSLSSLPIIDAYDMPTMSPFELHAKADSSGVESALADRIFQDILSQGEKLWGRYFADGQYAYANNVRRYIENKYHVSCQKLFVFGDLTAVSPRYGCCASWKYDVACALRGKGDAMYILDPRLFSSVVSRNKWIESHLYPTVSVPQPHLSSQAVVAGEAFTPLDTMPSGYQLDTAYVFTDIMVAHYADSVGCKQILN